MTTFVNEPLLELRRVSVRAELSQQLTELDAQFPLRVPSVIDGDRQHGDDLRSVDPGTPDRTVALAPTARPEDVDAAVAAVTVGSRQWGSTPAAARAATLVRAAGILRGRRQRLAALAVRECAKPWKEADGDVAEAIDFLEYYAARAVELDAGEVLSQVPGEHNTLRYVPRGVVAVVAPWNFPMAILAGMTAAGLATGNGVVVKPAEQSPACGWQVVRALLDAGVPPEALALVHGAGEVGAALVGHPGVQTVAFTGSAAVGLEIMARAGQVPAGQGDLKRVIAELGGKNCIIVDADADLDDAVPAIAYSAFGYAGQKCSAAGRVLAHETIADDLASRLVGVLDTLLVDDASTFGVDVPPVIEAESQSRLERYVALAQQVSPSVRRGHPGPSADGFYVAPTVVISPPGDAGVVTDEMFGPVVTIEAVADVEDACAVVDRQPVALTGGLFSRNPATVDRVASRLRVGNLYVNRHITGAMVGRQPFGGNRLSGNGTKAGGPRYLQHFVDPVVVTENTVRHGLVV
jgi:RHH-type proline utilization regulon transcriptional repressor/proline dehydrogenase/delta 1-pyrroline-5-carboxylate dehydrogenase